MKVTEPDNLVLENLRVIRGEMEKMSDRMDTLASEMATMRRQVARIMTCGGMLGEARVMAQPGPTRDETIRRLNESTDVWEATIRAFAVETLGLQTAQDQSSDFILVRLDEHSARIGISDGLFVFEATGDHKRRFMDGTERRCYPEELVASIEAFANGN